MVLVNVVGNVRFTRTYQHRIPKSNELRWCRTFDTESPLAIFTGDLFDDLRAKTAHGVIRYGVCGRSRP